MAKWYNVDSSNGATAYNMEWFREITLYSYTTTGYSHTTTERKRWGLRFEYARPHPDPDEHWTHENVAIHTDFDTMKALYDKVIEWLQSPDQAVFHQKQALEECLRETGYGISEV